MDVWRPTIYVHQSMTAKHPSFWYYPFRVADIHDKTPFVVPEQTRYLFCQTWTASVWICRLHGRDKGKAWWDLLLTADKMDLQCGISSIGRLWPCNAEQFEEETGSMTEADDYRALADVVAVSRSSSGGQRRERYEGPLHRDEINVLWIKWVRGIVYRLASGFLYEEDWNRLDLKEIDLVLG